MGETTVAVDAVRTAWLSALAGGVGGALRIMGELLWQIARKEFDPHRVMYFAVKPVMGFVLGAIAFFILQAGFLVIEFSISDGLLADQLALLAIVVMAIQIILGLLAVFGNSGC